MYKHLTAALVGFGVLALAGVARADDAAEAKAVVEKAIKATGGADKLGKVKGATFTMKGTYYGMGDGLPFNANYAVLWPDKFRMEIVDVFLIVMDGDKGWTKTGGDVKEMDKDELAVHKEGTYIDSLHRLTPLLDKGVTLTKIDEIKVDDKPAVGIKAAHKGHPDVSLYFDKESGLLVKVVARVKSAEQGYKEVTQESFFKDYKDVDGLKVAMKVVDKREGKPFVEAEMVDMKFVEKQDAKQFAKP